MTENQCVKHGPHAPGECPQCDELAEARSIVATTYIPPAPPSKDLICTCKAEHWQWHDETCPLSATQKKRGEAVTSKTASIRTALRDAIELIETADWTAFSLGDRAKLDAARLALKSLPDETTALHPGSLGPKAYCCQPLCFSGALFEIQWGSGPDDYTHSCESHVGALIGHNPDRPEPEHYRVYLWRGSPVEPTPPHPGPSIEKAFANSPRRVEPSVCSGVVVRKGCTCDPTQYGGHCMCPPSQITVEYVQPEKASGDECPAHNSGCHVRDGSGVCPLCKQSVNGNGDAT